ncbi:hypothetical protein ACHAQI_008003 [Fusarium lateritium]
MQLLKGLILGLLVNRGVGQTESLPSGEGAVATTADPVVTDAPDPSVLEPSEPQPNGQYDQSPLIHIEATEEEESQASVENISLTGLKESTADTGGDAGDAPTITIDEPEPSDARRPADEPTQEPTQEPTVVEDPAEPSEIPDDPVETQTPNTEEPEPTDQPQTSEPEPAPTETEVDDTQTLDEDIPAETETNGENTQTEDQEAMQTEAETPVITTEAPLNSAVEEDTSIAEDTSVVKATSAAEVTPSGGEAPTTVSKPDVVPATTTSTSAASSADYVVDQDTTSAEDQDVQSTTNVDPGEPTGKKTNQLIAPTETKKEDVEGTQDADADEETGTRGDYKDPTNTGDNEKPKETKPSHSGPGGKASDEATGKASAPATAGSGKGSSATATDSSPGPTSVPEDIPVQLEDSKLGDYAAFKDKDGETILLLNPPPNKEATCDLPPTGGDDVPLGEYIRLVLSVRVQQVGTNANQREEKTGSRLKVLVDKTPVYDQELVGTGGDLQTVSTEKFEAAKDQKIRMVQQTGDAPVELEIQDANIRLASTENRSGSGDEDDGKEGDDGKGSGADKGNGGKDGGGDSRSGSGSGSGSDDKNGSSGNGDGSGDSGSGDDGSNGNNGGSGGGTGDNDTGSGSPSGTSDEDSSPSATTGSESAANAAGKLQMVSELLIYVLPLAAAFMG